MEKVYGKQHTFSEWKKSYESDKEYALLVSIAYIGMIKNSIIWLQIQTGFRQRHIIIPLTTWNIYLGKVMKKVKKRNQNYVQKKWWRNSITPQTKWMQISFFFSRIEGGYPWACQVFVSLAII